MAHIEIVDGNLELASELCKNFGWTRNHTAIRMVDMEFIIKTITAGKGSEIERHLLDTLHWWSSVTGRDKFRFVCVKLRYTKSSNHNNEIKDDYIMPHKDDGTDVSMTSHRVLTDPPTITEHFGLVPSDSPDGTYTMSAKLTVPVFNSVDNIEE